MFLRLSLTLAALLIGVGDLAALVMLLTWQERAAPDARRLRLLVGVLPGSSLLLLVLLGVLFSLMLLWLPR